MMKGRMDGLSGLTIGEVLKNHAINYPKHIAVVDVDHEKRYTFDQLNNRVNRLANSLLDMGIQKGDSVGIFMRDLVEFFELMCALNKIGAIWAPCNYRFTAGEAQRQLEHSDPKMLFFEEEYFDLVEEIRRNMPNIEKYVVVGETKKPRYQLYEALLDGSSEGDPEPKDEVSSKDVIGIIYTSGTTGVAKGPMHKLKMKSDYLKALPAEKGVGTVSEEKLRVMWAISGPFYSDPFRFLEERGVSVPYWHIGAGSRISGCRYPNYGDESEYGRKLTPLEEEARILNCSAWGGLGDRWIEDTLYICRDLNIDAIIYFQQWGCTVSHNLGKLVADSSEKELGIPTLLVEGRMLVEETFDQRQFEEMLEDFVDICIKYKYESGKGS